MDPVSLALGIAPLCVGALKGAKHARSKIKLLKNHDREVSRLRKRLRTQMSIFQDETQLLLQDAGVDHDLVAQMLDDFHHEDWSGTELDSQIRDFLGRKYAELKQTAEQIRDHVTEFNANLRFHEDPDERSSDSGKVSFASSTPPSSLVIIYSDLDQPGCHHSSQSSESCQASGQKVQPRRGH